MAFPKLIIWHCFNHRLELAVGQVINEVVGVNHFKIFMDKLYTLYHTSPKNVNELRKIASLLEIQILKIGRILSIRWVASNKRTVNAVLNNFSALCEHINLTSMDSKRDSSERKKYNRLYKMITSIQFVSNLNIMSNA